jgi:DNA polymerase-3 subunit delta'
MHFRDIIGQDASKQRLVNSVSEGRISHAQLFFGSEGSGTLPMALAFARYIHCTRRTATEACGECPSCVKYDKLVHPDLHFVYPIALSKDVRHSTHVIAKWREAVLENAYLTLDEWFEKLEAENKQAVIGTEESGETLRKLSFTTFEAEYKIMIIWMAEKMNVVAANKLLKILEEPPDKTLFILVTENEGELLRTIVSRTQLVKIGRISDRDMQEALMKRHSLSEPDAQKLTYQADGNYAVARQLIQRSEQAAYNLALFQKWMRACLKFDAPKVMESVDELAAGGRERQKQFIMYALDLVRDSLLLHFGDESMVRLSGEELAFVKKFAAFVHGANGERFIEELNKVHLHIERNGSPKIIFTDMSFRLNEILNVAKVV